MRRLVLVANPAASGFTTSLHGEVSALLDEGFAVETAWPTDAEGARRAAAEAAAGGTDVVAAMGGDGVIHQVAHGLVGTGTALAIIPAGTTNVLRRIVGYPSDPRDAAAAVARSAATRTVPLAAVTTRGPAGTRTRLATFAAGVGFDAAVVRRAERNPLSKIGLGGLHYALSTLGVLIGDYRTRLPHLRVSAGGGRRTDAVAVMVQLHRVFTYFGPVPLRLDGPHPPPVAAIAREVRTLRTLRLLGGAAFGADPSRLDGVDVWSGFEALRIEAEPPVWAEADGELLGEAHTVEIRPNAERLSLVEVGPPIRKRISLR
jgi:diacylglycerol kinase family enzyme